MCNCICEALEIVNYNLMQLHNFIILLIFVLAILIPMCFWGYIIHSKIKNYYRNVAKNDNRTHN